MKEILRKNKMSFVDLNSGEIFNCKVGSRVWFHEKGHIEFNKTVEGNYLDYLRSTAFNLSIVLIILGVFLKSRIPTSLAFFFICMYAVFYVYEEVWCWVWGLKQFKAARRLENQNLSSNTNK